MSLSADKVEIPVEDVSQVLLASIDEQLEQFFVPILGTGPNLQLIGSGTLVEVDGEGYLLTAAHVWHAIKKSEQMHPVLTIRHPTHFSINCDNIAACELWKSDHEEWGPDLALLRIPEVDIQTIKAHKSFLNLSRQREEASQETSGIGIEKELWAVTGMVEEFSEAQLTDKVPGTNAHAVCRSFFSHTRQTHDRVEYGDVPISVEIRGAGIAG